MTIPSIVPYSLPTAATLPPNDASWHADPQRAVLLIHDMQHYFVSFFPAGEAPITDVVSNIATIKAKAVQYGLPIVYSAQPGGMSRAERGLLRDFWGPGMDAEPEHSEIVPALAPCAGDVVLTKWRYSAFIRTDLDEFMRREQRDQLIICGVYGHVGVLMTACDAFSRDVETFVVVDGIADFTVRDHMMALEYAARRCAVTLNTSTLLQQLAERARPERVR